MLPKWTRWLVSMRAMRFCKLTRVSKKWHSSELRKFHSPHGYQHQIHIFSDFVGQNSHFFWFLLDKIHIFSDFVEQNSHYFSKKLVKRDSMVGTHGKLDENRIHPVHTDSRLFARWYQTFPKFWSSEVLRLGPKVGPKQAPKTSNVAQLIWGTVKNHQKITQENHPKPF